MNIIFIHGLESSGKGFKGLYFKKTFPEILTPDFIEYDPEIKLKDLLTVRMEQLDEILRKGNLWVIIGSSFGGLMGALYALQNPREVRLLILLAPYLATRLLKWDRNSPIEIPVIVFHGKNDKLANYKQTRKQAYRLFSNLEFNATEDDHNLNPTVEKLNWRDLISYTLEND
ncbi:MAG: alpha/beta hydrolase [Promethearchaeota archaeon]|jgi:pimeloyl-ACP methyl ester carboxylesterase